MEKQVYIGKFREIGTISVIVSKEGVEKIYLGRPPSYMLPHPSLSPQGGGRLRKMFTCRRPADGRGLPFSRPLKNWFKRCLTGRPIKFPLRLVVKGTPFQLAVWNAIKEIPYGETRTYKWIAEKIGRPGASRAVGAACGANPLPLVIPCHRVVASKGLGGFSPGLRLKKKLLRLERII